MALCGSFLSGNRLNCLKIARTRVAPHALHHHYPRLFSSAIQRPNILHTNAFKIPRNTRDYWWSKSNPKLPPENPAVDTYTSPESYPIRPDELSSHIQSATTKSTNTPPIPPVEESLAGSSPPIAETFVQSSPPIDTSIADGLIDTVTSHLPPALQYGDLSTLGLITWTPAGFYRWILEIINVSTGLPWFHTIVIGAVLARVVLFPFTARGVRDSARLAPYASRLNALQLELKETQGDPVRFHHWRMKQKKVYQDSNVNPLVSVLNGFIQLPVTFGMFFGIKKMCEYPVEQLKYSGINMFPDLTSVDPTFILPVVCTALINLQLRIAARDMNTGGRPATMHMINYMSAFSVAAIVPMSLYLSTGILLSMATTSTMMILSSLILRNGLVRRVLDIPQLPPKMRLKVPSPIETWEFTKQYYREKAAAAEREAHIREARRGGRRV